MQTNHENPVTVEEIKALREEISLMHESLAKDVISHAPLVKKIVNLFINKGLNQLWIEKLLAPLVGSTFEDDEMMLLAYVLEELDSLLRVEDEFEIFEKKIHILVGATGIGKTSLVGKLGGRYTYLLDKPCNVAYLNYDSTKVGAVEQLEHYADAMNIPLIEVEDVVEDDSYDVIFIDTAGGVGCNVSELKSLIHIFSRSTSYEIEVSLVLSATAKLRDLAQSYKNFKSLHINNFMFTKLDETNDLSDMVNFIIEHETPVGYLSIGQGIPEDLVVASKEYLLNQFMKRNRDGE